MVKNHNLARHIADAAFGEIFRELEYKAAWYGRTYLELDRFFPSSKLCSSCGHLLEELPLSVRDWDCPACGAHHDRDVNAATNIKKAGQYLLKWLKTTRSGAGKVTPTRNERRRPSVGIPRHNATAFGGGRMSTQTPVRKPEPLIVNLRL
jgi:putative transposase